MNRRLTTVIAAIVFFVGGITAHKVVEDVSADGWSGLVYSVNGTSGDANGNVGVMTVNSKTVNSSVPENADFVQYGKNTTDITDINLLIMGLTATAEDVATDKTFIGLNGELKNGTLVPGIDISELNHSLTSSAASSTYTCTDDGIYSVTVVSALANSFYPSGNFKINGETITPDYENKWQPDTTSGISASVYFSGFTRYLNKGDVVKVEGTYVSDRGKMEVTKITADAPISGDVQIPTVSDISVTTYSANSSEVYDSGENKQPTKIRVVEGSVVYQGHTMYISMNLQGSDDATNWTSIDSVTKSCGAWNNIASQLPVEFGMHNEYRYYRIVFSTWADGSQVTIYACPQYMMVVMD